MRAERELEITTFPDKQKTKHPRFGDIRLAYKIPERSWCIENVSSHEVLLVRIGIFIYG